MNNQVGEVVAEVMATKNGVKVMHLPSMIRVDATNARHRRLRRDLRGPRRGGYFNAAEFEENMSTHYGRMIHQDDRTLMFANPEDAADLLGFDLTASN